MTSFLSKGGGIREREFLKSKQLSQNSSRQNRDKTLRLEYKYGKGRNKPR